MEWQKMEAIVKSDYNSREVTKLSLRIGDVVEEVVDLNDGWCFGNLGGKHGLFPTSYVELRKVTEHVLGGTSTTFDYVPRGEAVTQQSSILGTMTTPITITGVPVGDKQHCSDKQGQEFSGHVSLPSIKSASEVAISSQVTRPSIGLSTVSASTRSIPTSIKQNVGSPSSGISCAPKETQQSNMEFSDQEHLSSRSPSSIEHLGGSSGVSLPMREKAIVNVAYQAVDHDEISVQKGDVVDVVSKTTEEEEWWKVCLGGREGILPKGFLELVTHVPKSPAESSTKNATKRKASSASLDNTSAHTKKSQDSKTSQNTCIPKKARDSVNVLPEQRDEEKSFFPSRKRSAACLNTISTQDQQLQRAHTCPPSCGSSKNAIEEVKAVSVQREVVEETISTSHSRGATEAEELKATVKVPYEAIDDDEISVQVGDVVDVISRSTEDEGWWKVRLGKKEGLLPEIFLQSTTATVLANDGQSEREEHWLTVVVSDSEKHDNVITSSTNFLTSNTGSSAKSEVSHQQMDPVHAATESEGEQSVLNATESHQTKTISKQRAATVNASPKSSLPAIHSDSPSDFTSVHNEISTVFTQARQDITAHCMLIPFLSSSESRETIAAISQTYGVQVSLVKTSGQLCLIGDFARASRQINQLRKVQAKDYLIPKEPISEFYTWTFMNKTCEREQLPPFVSRILNNLHHHDQVSFHVDGILYTADLSAMTLTDTRTGETAPLYKPRSPTWLFSLDQNCQQYLNFVENDSNTLESMYRYGGSGIVLSGVHHLIEFVSMCELNLDTGVSTSIRRNPPPLSNSLPDYICRLAVTGPTEGLNEAVKQITKQLEPLCIATSLTFKLGVISSHTLWQNIIVIHAFNMFRQYFVQMVSLEAKDGVLVVQLRGERDYCERIKALVKDQLVDIKDQLVDLLQSAVVQNSSIRTSLWSNVPAEWEPQTSDMELKSVRQHSQEWNNIVGMVHRTLPAAQVSQISRVQNRQLWEKYALERDHMENRNNGIVNEKLLFHGTRKNDPKIVALSLRGIDFRFSRRDHRLLWGTGAYFAVKASYSDRYCYTNLAINARQMIIAKVLTGHSCLHRHSDPRLTRPPPLFPGSTLLYDTVCGDNAGSDIYVVYDQDRVYPAYIITYVVC